MGTLLAPNLSECSPSGASTVAHLVEKARSVRLFLGLFKVSRKTLEATVLPSRGVGG